MNDPQRPEPFGQTPSQTVGPFFHIGMDREPQNDLVTEAVAGHRVSISGTVTDGDGRPVDDAVVEIWQPDANGIYDHPEDPLRDRSDAAFFGFGRAVTGPDGRYGFRTIKPGLRPVEDERYEPAPYINVRVFARGMLVHQVTRIYFEDEPGNESDELLTSLESDRRRTLIARRDPDAPGHGYLFDIRLQGEGETVFLDL